jgi:aspartate aminotransferase
MKDKLNKRGITTADVLCERLLEECGIAILPGVDFNRPVDELSARLSYVDFDGAKALSASYRVPLQEPLPHDFLKHYCPNVKKAARLIVDWANK